MIISKYYNYLSKSKKEDLVVGLVAGLVWGSVGGLFWGLVVGLFWGLVVGLVWGLVGGLVAGLVWGLVGGLVAGLVVGLIVILINYPEAFPTLTSFYPILFIILGIVFLAEILFWLMPKEKVKPKRIFWHTIKRKFECIFEVLMGLSAVAQVYILGREIQIKQYFPEILKWIGYIGAGIIILALIVGAFYIWIKLNSLKYREKRP